MKYFMLGAGMATGFLLTALVVARWAFGKDYIQLCERDYDDDCSWYFTRTMTTTLN